jgi:nucleoside-diphosphate-sugar epimerase
LAPQQTAAIRNGSLRPLVETHPNRWVYAVGVKPLPGEDLEHIFTHTRPLWDRIGGRRIFISGGTGFFGAWLLESLIYCNRKLRLDLSATVLTRDPNAFRVRMPHLAVDPAIELLHGDVRDFALPDQVFEFVLHGAVSTSAGAGQNPGELLSTLIHGTERVLELAQTRGTKKFLFASSGAVYGKQPENLSHIPESYLGGPEWLDPNAAYGEGKRISEQLCSLAAAESGMDLAIARCFAFVGPHLPLDQHFAIGNFIADALAARNIAVRGDGTAVRSYLYAADLAIWLWTMLLGESESPRTLAVNVGSRDAISIGELAQLVVDELDPSLEVEIAQKPLPGASRAQYVPDVGKAESIFGLRPEISLREAIRRTAQWYR